MPDPLRLVRPPTLKILPLHTRVKDYCCNVDRRLVKLGVVVIELLLAKIDSCREVVFGRKEFRIQVLSGLSDRVSESKVFEVPEELLVGRKHVLYTAKLAANFAL